MGLQMLTDNKNITVYRNDKQTSNGGTFATYCVKVGSKDRNDNTKWNNAFIDIVLKKGVELNNKAVISIKNAFPVVNKYTDRNGNEVSQIKWMIMDFEIIEQGEVKQNVTPNNDGFMNIPDGLPDEELPFS